jgi:asparagine synthase (glutamine-hydrolysing)
VTDPAAIPLYFLSMVASRQVKVVLSGEGSDELFAGYPIYQYMAAIEQYRRIPQPLRQAVFNPVLRALWRSRSTKIDKYIFLSDLPVQRRYLNVNLFDVRLRQNIYDPDFRHTLAGFDAVDAIQPVYQRTEGWDLLSRLLYLDSKTWLPNDILIKADRMSMAASIELRTPFLDYRLAEYAASIPSRFKIRRNQSKYILRRTFRDLVPKLTLRRGKMGFPVPLAAMFRGSHRPFLEETLLDSDSKDTPYLNLKFVRGLLDEQLTGQADHHQTLWRILILRQWRRHFASAASSPGAFAAGAGLFQHS